MSSCRHTRRQVPEAVHRGSEALGGAQTGSRHSPQSGHAHSFHLRGRCDYRRGGREGSSGREEFYLSRSCFNFVLYTCIYVFVYFLTAALSFHHLPSESFSPPSPLPPLPPSSPLSPSLFVGSLIQTVRRRWSLTGGPSTTTPSMTLGEHRQSTLTRAMTK